MVDRTQQFYDEVATENGGREPTTTPFPYIFTVDEEHADLLKVYKKIIDDTKAWGFDSKGEIVDADILRQEYSFLDGDTLIGAAIIQNSGRLHFDHVKDEMMRRTRYNPAGKTNGKTVYATGVRAEEIMMGKGDKVTGVRTNRGTVYTPQVVMAPGAGILNLQNQLPRGVDVGSIVDKVNVHQRELFFAPV
jgi:glycine/D-amino acid oxidase-like deaminating enzyme